MKGRAHFRMVLPARPIPGQTRNRQRLLKPFREYVTKEAAKRDPPMLRPPLYLRVIWFANHSRGDVDNILKPICDALIEVIYTDDSDLVRVAAQRVDIREPYTLVTTDDQPISDELLVALESPKPDVLFIEVGEIRGKLGIEVPIGPGL